MSDEFGTGGYGHILCGVESQEVSAPANAESTRLAAPYGARVTLMHVCSSAAAFTGGTTSRSRPADELQAELIAEVHEWLDPLAARVGAQAQVIVGDDPAYAMSDWAREAAVDMIVICPHRRGLSRILGSFASVIVRDAPCPVVLVPTR